MLQKDNQNPIPKNEAKSHLTLVLTNLNSFVVISIIFIETYTYIYSINNISFEINAASYDYIR